MSKRTKAMRKRAREAQQRFAAAVAISCPRRELNGRLSRRKEDVRHRVEMTEAEAKAVMIDARRRMTGLDEKVLDIVDAGRPNCGTIHGLMCLQERITRDQWNAAEWYLARRRAWLRAIECTGEGIENPHTGGFDEAAHERFCREAKADWAGVMDCLQEASIQNRSPIIGAMDHVLARQQDLPHLDGDVRVGLNSLAKLLL